jgi:hypothetical protein
MGNYLAKPNAKLERQQGGSLVSIKHLLLDFS